MCTKRIATPKAARKNDPMRSRTRRNKCPSKPMEIYTEAQARPPLYSPRYGIKLWSVWRLGRVCYQSPPIRGGTLESVLTRLRCSTRVSGSAKHFTHGTQWLIKYSAHGLQGHTVQFSHVSGANYAYSDLCQLKRSPLEWLNS